MAYRPGPLRIIGWIIKGIFGLLIAFIIGLLLWRMFISTKVPEKISAFIVTQPLKDAVSASEEGVEGLEMYDQDQASITRGETNAGYFSVVDYVIIPEAHQVQLILRYNNSTLEHVATDFKLSEAPSRDSDVFDITLVKTTDLTPDNEDDNIDKSNLSETRYYPAEVVSDTTLLYNYRRVVFEGVDIEADDVGLFVDLYYIERLDYSALPYGALCLYDRQMERIPYNLSSANRRLLESAK